MSNTRQSWWRRYVPSLAANPVSLAFKLLRAGKPAARSALYMAAAGIAVTPIDLILRPIERKRYEEASEPLEPIILVAGPPRSGTTLVAQYLINQFDVCYLNNLTSVFPRAPITINKLLGSFLQLGPGDYDAFYGKSRGLAGPNDALYIWDRWLGSDRDRVPTSLEPGAEIAIAQFFGALQASYELPVVNKVNRLNTCADLISNALPNAYFLCMQRDPLLLAQSLYIARDFISGDMATPYGVQHSDSVTNDPVEDVCRQVVFHENQALHQQELLGSDKFEFISYEGFCRNPAGLRELLSGKFPDLQYRSDRSSNSQSFEISNKRKLPEYIFERMQARLDELNAGTISCRHL